MARAAMFRTAMLKYVMLSVAVCLGYAGLARAQFQTPGPEHDRFKDQVGTWDVVMDMGGQQSKGTATYKMICGGMWLANDFQGDFGGLKFEGRGVDGYDQQKKKYVAVWTDSMTSAPLIMEGTYDPKTKLQVMTGESTGPDGKPQKFKNTTEMKDKDHMTFKMYMVQPDGKDQLAFTIEYTRKK
jgi:Protein of unknown function (DUF1579)